MSGHDHHHQHVHTNNKKVLLLSFVIITLFMVVEIAGGWLANSLALLSDGIHMLSDSISLGVALIAFIYAEKHATLQKTFGYKRFEVLAALFNGVTLFVISILISIEAIQRLFMPEKVQSLEMFALSLIGFIINLIVAGLMFTSSDTEHNLNMRGAFMHVIGDLLGSVGAMIAAIFIWLFGWSLADPIVSILMSLLILRSAWGITMSSINILMEGKPENVHIDEIIALLSSDTLIQNVHDCHLWTISTDLHAFSCHAVVSPQLTMRECEDLLKDIEQQLADKNVQHVTIQFETANHGHGNSVLCSSIHSA